MLKIPYQYILSFFLISLACGLYYLKPFGRHPCVNIYDWYGVLPQQVITQFEKETKIRVHYDVFDNNEMLEAKLLASNSGYDVVFPTVTPYAVRQINMHIYQKLDKSLLPNLKDINPILLQSLEKIDPDLDFILPYYWGTTGIAYDEDKLEELLPNTPKDGYALLFDPDIVKKISKIGISILQEPVDVFPQVLNYIGLDRNSRSYADLNKATQHLAQICPYIRRFSSSRFITDLVLGDVCVAQAWSGEALKAIDDAKNVGKNIKYIIPKEGAEIWIDAIAIPIGAPNVQNAHIFINFLLRPEISAQITNYSKIATMVTAAEPFIHKDILENSLIFPDKVFRDQLAILKPCYGKEADIYEKIRARIWAQLKMGKAVDFSHFQEMICKKQSFNSPVQD